jgi:hypothetical protein
MSVYKDLQKKIIPVSPFETMHSSHTNQTNKNSARSNICSNNQTKFLCSHKYRGRETHKLTLPANQGYTGLKAYDEVPSSANGSYAKPHNHAY